MLQLKKNLSIQWNVATVKTYLQDRLRLKTKGLLYTKKLFQKPFRKAVMKSLK